MSGKQNRGTGRDFRDLPSFSDLDPPALAALNAAARLVIYRAGQTVLFEGQEFDFVGVVASGALRIQKTLLDGRHSIVGLWVQGDILGCTIDGVSEFAIEAATDAEVFAFPRAQFEALLDEFPDLDQAVLLNILNELDRARDCIVIVSDQKIINRVAGFLLMMCKRFRGVEHLVEAGQNGIAIKIPVSRVDLAHLLGTRPESISRAFHALADNGDIDIMAPDLILIKDVSALAAKAGEEDHPLRGSKIK
ncbi:MAG: Crp/Fnr family transcriptional regulator [Sulfitobacter sp.]|nr:Crp/Fnr family transcriptional regulator [Sulfitobacter sp.]